ncbi:STS14 protein-like [Cucurbita pepo subsp. pepo]|uniref:STS14 protein-like n=1 Tax=Cucurbita pepo subsp. pepo TaxID=3664 RepID=UPI000C9D8959|nr:STS14 protein-like [Cucurbita pepo subsp. pepo]
MGINPTWVLPVLALGLFQIVAGQSSAAARDFLRFHNKARAEVGVEPLQWSQNLANLTGRLVRFQRNQKSCNPADVTRFRYGGNQDWSNRPVQWPGVAVGGWVEEKAFYNHTSNTCKEGRLCGAYTQVVCPKTKEVGCAQATCRKERITLTICFYNPPANGIGERPY